MVGETTRDINVKDLQVVSGAYVRIEANAAFTIDLGNFQPSSVDSCTIEETTNYSPTTLVACVP